MYYITYNVDMINGVVRDSQLLVGYEGEEYAEMTEKGFRCCVELDGKYDLRFFSECKDELDILFKCLLGEGLAGNSLYNTMTEEILDLAEEYRLDG